MMKLIDKELVLAALRSGGFTQGTGAVYQRKTTMEPARYCGNGVAAIALGWDFERSPVEGNPLFGVYDFLRRHGINSETSCKIIALNDGGHCALEEIADWFEANVPVNDDAVTEVEQYVHDANTAADSVAVAGG